MIAYCPFLDYRFSLAINVAALPAMKATESLAESIPALEKQTTIRYFKFQCVPRTKPFLGFGSRCPFHGKDAGPWSHQPHSVI